MEQVEESLLQFGMCCPSHLSSQPHHREPQRHTSSACLSWLSILCSLPFWLALPAFSHSGWVSAYREGLRMGLRGCPNSSSYSSNLHLFPNPEQGVNLVCAVILPRLRLLPRWWTACTATRRTQLRDSQHPIGHTILLKVNVAFYLHINVQLLRHSVRSGFNSL